MAKKRKTKMFQLKQKIEAPSVRGKNYPVNARIPSIDEIYDEKTDTNRLIRYVIGEQSIYEDEQTSAKPVLGDIVFSNGILPVQQQQVTLRKYLEASNYNGTNPNRMQGKKVLFNLVNHEFDAQKTTEAMEVEYLATDALMKMEAQKMVGYARAMGVDVDRSMYEIKHDMMVMAKGNPQLFMDEISNPMIERKQIIMDAVENEVVTYAQGKRQYLWSDNKQIIYTVAVGLEPLDALTEFTFEDEGTPVFSRIKRLLSGGKEEKVEEVKKMPKKMVKTD
jgi:hypothetical protein